MDLSIGSSTGHNAQILAQLGDIDQLYDLARETNSESREALAHAVSSVLEKELTARESELVADVLIALLKQAEKDVRQAMAERLSIMDEVPLRLVLHLANDEIDVAKPILNKSAVLGDFDLLYIIKSKPAEYWREIAMREYLSAQVMTVLAETGDFDTAMALVENTNITLTEEAMVALSDVAQEGDLLALPLLRRSEVSQDIAVRLYKYVSEDVKAFICENYDLDIQKVEPVLNDVIVEFVEPAATKDCAPEEHMMSAARSFKEKGALNVKLMLSSLRRGHIKSFIAQLSVYTDLPASTICKMLTQSSGQGLALVSKAHGIEKHDFLSMFMLTSKIWNHGRLVESQEIKTAISYYNKVTPELALSIMKENSKG